MDDTRMDAARIQALREMLGGATERPWQARSLTDDSVWATQHGHDVRLAETATDADAALIAAAVNALAPLLDEVERLEAKLHDAEEALAENEAAQGFLIDGPKIDLYARALERAEAAEAKLAAAEAEGVRLKARLRECHSVGLRHGMGPCVCEWCKEQP